MTQNIIGGIGAIAIGSAYLYLALQLSPSALADNVGPAGVPKVLAIIMIALGMVLAVQGVLARAAHGRQADLKRTVGRAAGLLMIGVAYLIVIPHAGYVLSIALLIIAVATYQGTAPGLRLLAVGVIGALSLWLVFVWLLDIPMPSGVLGHLF